MSHCSTTYVTASVPAIPLLAGRALEDDASVRTACVVVPGSNDTDGGETTAVSADGADAVNSNVVAAHALESVFVTTGRQLRVGRSGPGADVARVGARGGDRDRTGNSAGKREASGRCEGQPDRAITATNGSARRLSWLRASDV